MKINAKNLILDLLLAAGGRALTAREAVSAGALFRINSNNVRVALVRLSAEGLIDSAARGSYRLGPAAAKLAGEVATWRKAEQRIRKWNGGYLAVSCGSLGRSDRAALRRRERGLHMLGFRELDRNLHIRPDNIEKNATAVRERLYNLGLEPEAAVFVASDLDAAREERARALWDGEALNATYRSMREQLEEWMEESDGLEPAAAARESFLLGGRAIHQIVFDPLLPAPFVDTDARHEFIRTVLRFDQVGHAIWRRLLESVSVASTPLSGGPGGPSGRSRIIYHS